MTRLRTDAHIGNTGVLPHGGGGMAAIPRDSGLRPGATLFTFIALDTLLAFASIGA